MDNDTRRELRQYAWAYFDRHAEQRLKTFNFYLVLTGAVVAGVLAFKDSFYQSWPLLLLLSFISFVFWRLDLRNRVLTKHSEEALKAIEDSMDLDDEPEGVPNRCKLFRREEYESSRSRRYPGAAIHEAALSYTQCFGLLFALFGFGSFILACCLGFACLNGQGSAAEGDGTAPDPIGALEVE